MTGRDGDSERTAGRRAGRLRLAYRRLLRRVRPSAARAAAARVRDPHKCCGSVKETHSGRTRTPCFTGAPSPAVIDSAQTRTRLGHRRDRSMPAQVSGLGRRCISKDPTKRLGRTSVRPPSESLRTSGQSIRATSPLRRRQPSS